MALTLLETIEQACEELGLTAPNAAIGSSDTTVLQYIALVNRLLMDLVRENEWRRITKIHTFRTADSVTATGDPTVDTVTVTGMSSTASVSAGMQVSGTGIPDFTEVASVDSGSQITMSMAATATGNDVTLTFSTQDFALPSDFDRIVSATNWDRSDHWMNLGPKSSQEWQWLNGGSISTAPRFRWRLYRNVMRFFPAPADVYNMAYEYVSNWTVIPAAGTHPTKARVTVDTDTFVFTDDVMVLGLKYLWKKTKGLDFAVELAEFLRAMSYCKAQDEGNPTLSLSPTFATNLVSPSAIPDGSWDLS